MMSKEEMRQWWSTQPRWYRAKHELAWWWRKTSMNYIRPLVRASIRPAAAAWVALRWPREEPFFRKARTTLLVGSIRSEWPRTKKRPMTDAEKAAEARARVVCDEFNRQILGRNSGVDNAALYLDEIERSWDAL